MKNLIINLTVVIKSLKKNSKNKIEIKISISEVNFDLQREFQKMAKNEMWTVK